MGLVSPHNKNITILTGGWTAPAVKKGAQNLTPNFEERCRQKNPVLTWGFKFLLRWRLPHHGAPVHIQVCFNNPKKDWIHREKFWGHRARFWERLPHRTELGCTDLCCVLCRWRLSWSNASSDIQVHPPDLSCFSPSNFLRVLAKSTSRIWSILRDHKLSKMVWIDPFGIGSYIFFTLWSSR